MKKNLFILSLLLFFFSSAAMAQSARLALLHLESQKEPVKATGFLLSARGALQKPDTEIRSLPQGGYRISFLYSQEEIFPDSFATAMVELRDGEIIFTRSTPLRRNSLKSPLASLPLCDKSHSFTGNLNAQLGQLESLVELREGRLERTKAAVEEALQGGFLKQLRRMEEGFGIQEFDPISAELSSTELLDRLFRISAAAKSYAVHKQASSSK